MRLEPGPSLRDFMFPLLYSPEKLGYRFESIAKSHEAHCEEENLTTTFFGKIRKRRRVPWNQDPPDQRQALCDCSSPSRGFAHNIREIA